MALVEPKSLALVEPC